MSRAKARHLPPSGLPRHFFFFFFPISEADFSIKFTLSFCWDFDLTCNENAKKITQKKRIKNKNIQDSAPNCLRPQAKE